MKMLMFDFRDSEKSFFVTRKFKDIDITFISKPLNENTALSKEEYDETDVISVFINSNITKNVIKKFKNLRIITTRSTGYNHIDIAYCAKNNIAVFNVEKYGRTSVAQYTITLILALIRNLVPAFWDIKHGIIQHPDYEGRNIEDLTLGVIGCGSIGCSVVQMAQKLGFNILINSITKNCDTSSRVKFVSLKELLPVADIITLHLPYNGENYHFFGENEFAMMKNNSYFINTSRGELVDILALYKNLVNKKIKGAALDVLECEYLSENNQNIIEDIRNADSICITNALITKKILEMNNVIITPHIGYNTKESVEFLLDVTFNNILDYHKGLHNNQVC